MIHQVEPLITEADKKAICNYLDSGGWITEHKKTEEFEQKIAEYLGVEYAVLCPSGTVGLYLALLAGGIADNNEVVVPCYTMIATPNAVSWARGAVTLADVESDTLCLDLNKIKIGARTKFLIYVSINGRCGNIEEVQSFCRDNSITLIEDACQSFGSKHNGKPIGTFGDVGVFSLSPHKIITTGQGGIVVTNHKEIHNTLKKLKDFGRIKPGVDEHDSLGVNFKYTDLQASLGISQLESINSRITKKKLIYDEYSSRLGNYMEFLDFEDGNVPWFVDPLTESKEERGALQVCLNDNNVGSRVFYPPLTDQPMYNYILDSSNFSVTYNVAHRGLWLPSSLTLTEEQLDHVCNTVVGFYETRGK